MSHAAPHHFPAEHHVVELDKLLASPKVQAIYKRDLDQDGSHDVPDLAGYSVDGHTVYFDKDFYQKAPEIAGLNFRQLLDCLTEHEHVEKTLIDALGYSYAQAHEMATAAEHRKVTQYGASSEVYEAGLKPFIKRAEHEKIKHPPLDLDCHPYYDSPDKQDLVILAQLARLGVKDAQHEQTKLSHKSVQYGPGHAPEFCSKCQYFQVKRSGVNKETVRVESHCQLVQDPINQSGWCKLWKQRGQK